MPPAPVMPMVPEALAALEAHIPESPAPTGASASAAGVGPVPAQLTASNLKQVPRAPFFDDDDSSSVSSSWVTSESVDSMGITYSVEKVPVDSIGLRTKAAQEKLAEEAAKQKEAEAAKKAHAEKESAQNTHRAPVVAGKTIVPPTSAQALSASLNATLAEDGVIQSTAQASKPAASMAALPDAPPEVYSQANLPRPNLPTTSSEESSSFSESSTDLSAKKPQLSAGDDNNLNLKRKVIEMSNEPSRSSSSRSKEKAQSSPERNIAADATRKVLLVDGDYDQQDRSVKRPRRDYTNDAKDDGTSDQPPKPSGYLPRKTSNEELAKIVGPQTDFAFTCPVCSKGFQYAESFETHKRVSGHQ